MKRTALFVILAAGILALPLTAAKLQVVTTYPYIAKLTEHIGGAQVNVHALAGGQWDPHTIMAKPSFIAKLRRADLLIINGAQLEIGWLPPLLSQANNPKVNVGSQGMLDLSRAVKLIDVPDSVSRAHGDIHPDGNPHYYLNPDNMLPLAEAIAAKLERMDPAASQTFVENLAQFKLKWQAKLAEWEKRLAPLSGAWVIEYHKNYDYLLRRYGLQLLGTVELLPGIPPTSKHIQELENKIAGAKVRCILQDVYNPDEASRHLASKHDIPMIKLPHDVGAVREAEGLFSMFDEIVRRLSHE
ncbi:MAG TPA: zinc ABC transporter substrate-binding protein [Candidatus Aminicenantes bacterium]|nr:zinc ABC transporter substrate-binding protein [Candidatus Aminicenantes bacterium]